jgi:hypothetical protein
MDISQESASPRGGPLNDISKTRPKASHSNEPVGAPPVQIDNPLVERGTSDGHVDRFETRMVPDGYHTILPEPLGLMEDMWAVPPNNFECVKQAIFGFDVHR